MYEQLKLVAASLLPLLIALLIALSQREPAALAPQPEAASTQAQAPGRLVVVIVDSLRASALDEHMPHTRHPLRGPLIRRPVTTCRANFSLPCIRTLLEGRESPFSAGLHNFTGQRGGPESLPAIAHAAGHKVALISDVTLESLYGQDAAITHNLERWPGDRLAKDTRAVEEARRALDDPALDLVILHTVGTDKVAHERGVGHPLYIQQFEGVDAALSKLYAQLDPTRDHLIITGDHGHDDSGFHNPASLVLLQGPRFEALGQAAIPPALNQPDLLGLMALALDLQLPATYEGRLLGLTPLPDDAPAALIRMESRERASLARQGFTGPTLAAQLDDRAQSRAWAPWHDIARIAPWFALYLWYLLSLHAAISGASRSRALAAPAALAALIALTSALVPTALATPAALALLAATLLAAARDAHRAGRLPALVALTALLTLAALTSAAGMSWSETLHMSAEKGRRWGNLVAFYAAWLACGAATARLLWRRAAALPEGLALAALLALPSGVYYYNFGQNILSGLIFGGAILALLRWRDAAATLRAATTRERAAAAALLIAAALSLWQRGAAWTWLHVPWERLKGAPLAATALTLTLCAALVALMHRRRAPRAAPLMAATLAAALLYSVGFAGLPMRDLFSALIPALLAGAALSLQHKTLRPELSPRIEVQQSILIALALCASAWFLCRGYTLTNIDFKFGLERFGHLKHERDVAIIVYLLTIPKYMLAITPTALTAALCPPRVHFKALLLAALVLHAKVLALMIQIFAGPLGGPTKLHELAVNDLIFVFHLALLLTLMAALTAISQRHTAHTTTRDAS